MKKISVKELSVGMYVIDTGLSWIDHPFLYSQEGAVASKEQLEAIRTEGYKDVFIDTSRGWGLPNAKSPRSDQMADEELEAALELLATAKRKERKEKPKVPIKEEIQVARKLYSDSLKLARSFISDIKQGSQLDYAKSEQFVTEAIESVTRNPDALISLTKLRAFDEYTFTHSINVSVLAIAFGKHLGLNSALLRALGQSALFHDVGKALIPGEVLNKPGKLTDEEFSIIKAHPEKGYSILQSQHALSALITRGVVEHHEKFNGRGYPSGLAGDDISLFGSLIAVADVYDALTSDRVYKKGMPANRALSIMYGMREEDYPPMLVEQFIKCLGIYPVGSFVRLNDKQYAVVIGSNPSKPLFPTIKIILDAKQRPRAPEILDLALARAQAQREKKPTLRIAENLDPKLFNIDPATHLL
jgi:putative nucleotidyltransferase with HDIG domain